MLYYVKLVQKKPIIPIPKLKITAMGMNETEYIIIYKGNVYEVNY